ncbi:hypothetical protein FI667_g3232, partial [Globisporangium splendens]
MDSTEDACQGMYQEKHDVIAGDACLVLNDGEDDDGVVLFDTTTLSSARGSNNKPLSMATPSSDTVPDPTEMTSKLSTVASGTGSSFEYDKVTLCAHSDDHDVARDPEATSDLSVEETSEDANTTNGSGVINFDAFVAGSGNEAEPTTSAATASTPRSSSTLRPLVSMRNAAVKLVLVKEKTHEVAQSQKLALANFHKSGGLVGWLHGGPDAFEDDPEEEQQGDDIPLEESTESVADALRSVLLPSDPMVSPSIQVPLQHRSFPMRQQIPSPSNNRSTSGSSPTRGFTKNPLGRTQRASSLLENLYEKMKGTTTATTAAATSPPTSPNMRRERRSSDSGAGARVALQPSPRKQAIVCSDPCSIGFDDFAASSSESDAVVAPRKAKGDYGDSPHQRNGPAAESSNLGRPLLKARLSFGSFSSLPLEPSCPPENDTTELSLDECLVDKKLAAEFVNTVMPDDATLLKLLYSIEEFETLVTTEPIPALSVQVTYATTLIDNFLIQGVSHPSQPHRSLPWLSKMPKNLASDLKLTIEQLENGKATSLPTPLFQAVHGAVYSVLRDGYEAFTHTREYAHLLEQHRQQQQRNEDARGASAIVMTVDSILANEWYCTVFWIHLYRTSHHHRLSFLMDKAFKLDKLYREYLENASQTTEHTTSSMDTLATEAEVSCSNNHLQNGSYASLVRQLRLMARKYLQKAAPVALPVTTAALCRLKEEICIEVTHLATSLIDTESDFAGILERVMTKLDALSDGVQKELKRLSFERFASFTTSTLYRDFIAVPPPRPSSPTSNGSNGSSSTGDVVQLLRASQISFHQAPNDIPQVHLLSSLCESSSSSIDASVPSNDAIYKVFSFVKRDVVNAQKRLQPYEIVDLVASSRTDNTSSSNSPAAGSPVDETLGAHEQTSVVCQTIEHFLIPEASPRTFQITDTEIQQNLSFNLSLATARTLSTVPCGGFRLCKATESQRKLLSVAHGRRIAQVPAASAYMEPHLRARAPTGAERVRNSELPRASDDLVIVNFDRDSLTGGGNVTWSPTRSASMRDRFVKICKPRLQLRDNIEFNGAENLGNGNGSSTNGSFPMEAIRRVFYDELQDMLSTLEAFAFRFAFHDKFVTVVDSSNKSRAWTSDTSRFYATLLQTQAFSAHLSSLQNLALQRRRRGDSGAAATAGSRALVAMLSLYVVLLALTVVINAVARCVWLALAISRRALRNGYEPVIELQQQRVQHSSEN